VALAKGVVDLGHDGAQAAVARWQYQKLTGLKV
jgi:hypothetical protein